MRTKISLVHPTNQKMPKVDLENFGNFQQNYRQNMKRQFNDKNGAKTITFQNEEPIFIWNLKGNKANWLPATIIERVGNSPTYRVDVPTLHRAVHRHANQIRRRCPVELVAPQIGQANGNNLAGDPTNRTPIKEIEKAKSPIGQNQNAPRRSARTKTAPQRLDMDPSKPKYNLVRLSKFSFLHKWRSWVDLSSASNSNSNRYWATSVSPVTKYCLLSVAAVLRRRRQVKRPTTTNCSNEKQWQTKRSETQTEQQQQNN
ncbi:hypothetical protein niasHS_004392 [Heterodera schachtii]|uniref:Uncharacterized protein n=1 Tax=Heterodera schachtii TaxID=97005 RepID=A0ABD2K1D4_HETSC